VQHHHAHIAACLAENGYHAEEPVIGVAFDGTGYGTDGAIWGGEFLVADYQGYQRALHLEYIPLPGGDAGTRKPARGALSYLLSSGVEPEDDLPPLEALSVQERRIVERQVCSRLNAPLTSSMGRLFDAVASIIGVRQEVNYEAQAAIELEALVDPHEGGVYPFDLGRDMIGVQPLIRAIVADTLAGLPKSVIAARFHNSLVTMILEACLRLREQYELKSVALSGGVFQNVTLLEKTLARLRAARFMVYTHRLTHPNDGGLALGQLAVVDTNMK
jgi:hydrogenase maturation protein HypF